MRRIFYSIVLACLVLPAAGAFAADDTAQPQDTVPRPAYDMPIHAPPSSSRVFHAGWFVDKPQDLVENLDGSIGASFVMRNLQLFNDWIETDLFVTRSKVTQQGLMLRNESDLTTELAMAGCGLYHLEGKPNTKGLGFRTFVVLDDPKTASMNLVLPPRTFTLLTLVDSPDRTPAAYPGMPKFGPHNLAFLQCSTLTVSHPPP